MTWGFTVIQEGVGLEGWALVGDTRWTYIVVRVHSMNMHLTNHFESQDELSTFQVFNPASTKSFIHCFLSSSKHGYAHPSASPHPPNLCHNCFLKPQTSQSTQFLPILDIRMCNLSGQFLSSSCNKYFWYSKSIKEFSTLIVLILTKCFIPTLIENILVLLTKVKQLTIIQTNEYYSELGSTQAA